ncbi:MAG: hypothetical protein WCP90_05570, partial [Opitutae bacterium]
SADPIVQAPDNTQSYNRYSYCLNNPLNLTDPSGYSWFSKGWKSITHAFSSAFNAIGSAFKAVAKWVAQNWRIIVTAVVTVVVGLIMPPLVGAMFPLLGSTGLMVASAGIGGTIIGACNAAIYGEPPLKILESALVYGITAAVTAGIGHVLFTGNITPGQLVEKSIMHGLAQGASSQIMNHDFKSGFIGGFISSLGGGMMNDAGLDSWEGRVLRVVAMGAVGGTAAQLSGGSFANGAISAAFVQMFNDEASVAKKSWFDKAKEWAGDKIEDKLIHTALDKIYDGLSTTYDTVKGVYDQVKSLWEFDKSIINFTAAGDEWAARYSRLGSATTSPDEVDNAASAQSNAFKDKLIDVGIAATKVPGISPVFGKPPVAPQPHP